MVTCEVARKDLRGAGAERALLLLARLKEELHDAIWLPEYVPAALDKLQDDLPLSASKRREGRPRDSLGHTFRRNMQIFFSHGVLLKDGWRSLSQPEIDEILNDLFRVAIGGPKPCFLRASALDHRSANDRCPAIS
jgi:hypothetical protein